MTAWPLAPVGPAEAPPGPHRLISPSPAVAPLSSWCQPRSPSKCSDAPEPPHRGLTPCSLPPGTRTTGWLGACQRAASKEMGQVPGSLSDPRKLEAMSWDPRCHLPFEHGPSGDAKSRSETQLCCRLSWLFRLPEQRQVLVPCRADCVEQVFQSLPLAGGDKRSLLGLKITGLPGREAESVRIWVSKVVARCTVP